MFSAYTKIDNNRKIKYRQPYFMEKQIHNIFASLREIMASGIFIGLVSSLEI